MLRVRTEHTHTNRADYLAMGLYHIANAVSFLNNDCNLVRWR